MLLPLQSGTMLVPYSVVQEIIAYRSPEPSEAMPSWILGMLDWHRWKLPVISAEKLLGAAFAATGKKRHIVVCNLLNGDDTLPCVGVVTQGIPQLVRVDADAMIPLGEASPSPWVAQQLRFRGEEVWIPALKELARDLASLLT
jgi:chemosensory pili system protein ChpC